MLICRECKLSKSNSQNYLKISFLLNTIIWLTNTTRIRKLESESRGLSYETFKFIDNIIDLYSWLKVMASFLSFYRGWLQYTWVAIELRKTLTPLRCIGSISRALSWTAVCIRIGYLCFSRNKTANLKKIT